MKNDIVFMATTVINTHDNIFLILRDCHFKLW